MNITEKTKAFLIALVFVAVVYLFGQTVANTFFHYSTKGRLQMQQSEKVNAHLKSITKPSEKRKIAKAKAQVKVATATKAKTQKTGKEKRKEKKAGKVSARSTIDYTPQVKGKPQRVREFGSDKGSRDAKTAFAIARFFFTRLQKTEFSAPEACALVTKLTGVDLSQVYHKRYPDSPLHQGLHRISKGETDEKRTNKQGVTSDTFARGKRKLVLKDTQVGIGRPDGYYRKNPRVEYPMIDDAELRGSLKRLVEKFA